MSRRVGVVLDQDVLAGAGRHDDGGRRAAAEVRRRRRGEAPTAEEQAREEAGSGARPAQLERVGRRAHLLPQVARLLPARPQDGLARHTRQVSHTG